MNSRTLSILAGGLIAVAAGLLIYRNPVNHPSLELLNVSYDPTRELYDKIDTRFASRFTRDTGTVIAIRHSHGGSSRQVKAVEGGLAADVVTLGLPSDIEALRKFGLVAGDWQQHFPNNAQPYFSTVVFVVRHGNPHHIHEWSDLAVPGLEVVTPNPKTSANGKLSFLGAWGSVIFRGGTEQQARELVLKIFRNVGTQDAGARDASNSFELAGVGDVQVTWENEAIRESRQSAGELAIIYPAVSIRAEPSVALIESNIARHHVERAAQAYLSFLFDDEAQEIFAMEGYRPSSSAALAKHRDLLPDMTLFPITLLARDWNEAQVIFFDDGGILDGMRAHAGDH